ncbi:MAG TPA: S9 family peptidase [Tepidisphaeraceae bacterium]|nr:S9 family peptidase [Tepidisphaeraceae bacterium]
MRILVLAAALLFAGAAQAATAVDVASFVKRDSFDQIKLSPNGDYYAASVPGEDSSVLVIVRRADNKVTGGFGIGRNTYISDFAWVNPQRVVFGTARRFGALDNPQLTGNLYAMNADGTGKDILVGQDVDVMSTGSHIQTKKTEMVAAFLLDDLPADDHNVLISVSGFSGDSYNRVEKMDVYSGRRVPVARSPVRNSDYVTDADGVVRFAFGYETDNDHKLFYRAKTKVDWTNTADWREINDESSTGHIEVPLGFSADGNIAYLQVEQANGPDSIVALDTRDDTRKTVLRDDDSDPAAIIRSMGTPYPAPVGAFIDDGKPRTQFFDDASPEARLYRSLEAAFPGDLVEITSKTADGALALVRVSSDRDAGEFYLFDTVNKKAGYLLAPRQWQDPATMSEQRPFAFKARDGRMLHGFLTIPRGSDGKHLPTVVIPHGGPFFVADHWGFDTETQLIAAAGYAVVQVNFRGSSGYGRDFTQAGARQWGRALQDDITDATHWVVDQGYADPTRICIYGASYGGYAALMGLAREPSLYKCAAGYAGVYDLPLMFQKGDTQALDSGKAYLRGWIGDPTQLGAVSPVNLAGQIKAPVFLAAGGADERAPIAHSERMEKALRAAGVPVETLYFRTEGHGFYTDEHRIAFYTQLLAFLHRNIGGGAGVATTTGAAAAAAH